jgi:predicted naringenin-chalcone synthase
MIEAVVTKPVVVLPEHALGREKLKEMGEIVLGKDTTIYRRLMKIVDNSGVETRHLVQSLEDTMKPAGFGTRNDVFIAESKRMCTLAAERALESQGMKADEIDCIITTSCTGFMIPSVCAHIIPTLGFKRTTKRLPITFRGCAAGAFAMEEAQQFIRARGGGNVLIVAHELCSLTYQTGDMTMQALIGALLFGDGVAACIVRGDGKHKGPGFVVGESRTWLFENSWDYMGFDVKDSGLHLLLDKGIPGAVEDAIQPLMVGFLKEQGLSIKDIDFHVMHPGGRKLLDEVARTFEIEKTRLQASYDCLAEVGNLSSASIFVVLKNTFERYTPKDGQRGFLAAFGPGFSAEMSLGRFVA